MTPRETLRSGSQLLTLWMRSLVNSNLYRPFREASEPPHVSESWDSYWSAKSKPSGRMYDLVAGIYRQQVIRKRLEKVLTDAFDDGSHLLHAGCGSGQVDERLHDRLRITAVDISSAAARLYRSNNPTSSGVFEADISALPFPDATFDGVYNLGVMEHFDAGAIVQILSELNRVLKPGARLVLFWPHRRATSVAVLGSAHWIMNDVLKRSVQLHPPEVSLLKSRKWVEELLAEARLTLESYSFGPADFFVQAVVVARTNAAPAAHA
jgi:ubiquinone/menaquinone biosynthesis C-methylase UbiE